MAIQNPYRASAAEQSPRPKPSRAKWLAVVIVLGLLGLFLAGLLSTPVATTTGPANLQPAPAKGTFVPPD